MDDVQQQIEQRVHTLAKKKGIFRVGLKWGPAGPTLYPLTITSGTSRETTSFSQDELDGRDWPRIEKKLSMLLDTFKPAKR